MKRVTIYDIAEAAGVSPTTVSRALNNRGHQSEELRQTILEIAAKMNYTPNPAARYLKTHSTGQILLSLPDIQDLYFIDVVKAIQQEAASKGYSVLIHDTKFQKSEELGLFNGLESNFIDGLIHVSLFLNDEYIVPISQQRLPMVLCATSRCNVPQILNHCDFVGLDGYTGVDQAVSHLADMGYRSVGFVGYSAPVYAELERYQAFCNAAERCGLTFRPDWRFNVSAPSFDCGYEAGRQLLQLKEWPEAIFCTTDFLTLGLYRALNEAGVKMPDQIALVGLDDVFFDQYTQPNLTSIAYDPKEFGTMAFRLLYDRLQGKTPGKICHLVEPRLQIRDSSRRK